MAESLQPLSTTSFSVGRMVLLTEGSVLACTYTADPNRSYRQDMAPIGSRQSTKQLCQGNMAPVRSMNHLRHPLWLSAVVLKDGKVFVWGELVGRWTAPIHARDI
jgi:hypothetical protein